MKPTETQLVQAINRTIQYPQINNILWICDENTSDNCVASIQSSPKLSALTNRFDVGEKLKHRNIGTDISDFDFSNLEQYDAIFYRVSKERILSQHCITEAFKNLKENGTLSLFGEKTDGIKTYRQFADETFGTRTSIKKNGLSYTVTATKENSSQNTIQTNSAYSEKQLIDTPTLSFYSKPGLYGWKKIDKGSQLLIESFKQELINEKKSSLEQRNLLDLGCGYGYLTLEASKLGFTNLVATDNNITAIDMARENFQRQGINVNLSLDDCGKNLEQSFDIILCNPPFHKGFDHHSSLTEVFLAQAKKLLKTKGKTYFVVNEFIPLNKIANKFELNVNILNYTNGFKIFKLEKGLG